MENVEEESFGSRQEIWNLLFSGQLKKMMSGIIHGKIQNCHYNIGDLEELAHCKRSGLALDQYYDFFIELKIL